MISIHYLSVNQFELWVDQRPHIYPQDRQTDRQSVEGRDHGRQLDPTRILLNEP